MLAPLMCLWLAAAPPEPSVKLASPGLSYVKLDSKVGDFFSDYFAQQVVLQGGIRVTTKNEIQALLGFERQKQLLGCSDSSSSCLAELAGALGVDGIITGNLARFGGTYAITLKVLAAASGRPLAAYSGRLKGDDALLDWLGERAKELAATLKQSFRAPPAPRPSPAPPDAPVALTPPPPEAAPLAVEVTGEAPTWRSRAWIPAAAGGAVLVGGVVALVSGHSIRGRLLSDAPEVGTADELRSDISRGRTFEGLGIAGVALGVAGLGAAGALYLFGGDRDDSSVSVFVSPNGAGVTGSWP